MTDTQKEHFLRIMAEGLFVGLDHPFECLENNIRTLHVSIPAEGVPAFEAAANEAVFTFFKEYVHLKYSPEDPEYTHEAFDKEITTWFEWRRKRLEDYVRRHNAASGLTVQKPQVT